MNLQNTLIVLSICLIVLVLAYPVNCQVIGTYKEQKLAAERKRLESRTRQLWQMIYDNLLTPNEKAALKHVRLQFPTLSPDGSLLNFYADAGKDIIIMPIHSLLLLEDACAAYAWLYYNGYSAITINEYASMLKYRRVNDFPGGEYPPILQALDIPGDALTDTKVNDLSLRFRNSAWAYILVHEMGHILYRHPGNQIEDKAISRKNERQADEFALQVLRRDNEHVPMGAILFFQMTAFIASPCRFDYKTVEEWQQALQEATHPVTSDRVRALADGLGSKANQYGPNREIALDIAGQLKKLAVEMDDRDWQLYFRGIGEKADLSTLRPRKE